MGVVMASVVGLLSLGCSDSTSVDSDLVLGTIEISGNPMQAHVPDTVVAGCDFFRLKGGRHGASCTTP